MIPKNADCVLYNAFGDEFRKHTLRVFLEFDNGLKSIEKGVEGAGSVMVYIGNESNYITPGEWRILTAYEAADKFTVQVGDILYFGEKEPPDVFNTTVEIGKHFRPDNTYKIMSVYPAILPGGKLSHIEVRGVQ